MRPTPRDPFASHALGQRYGLRHRGIDPGAGAFLSHLSAALSGGVGTGHPSTPDDDRDVCVLAP